MASPFQRDPTRTITLRKAFIADMNRRIRALNFAIFDFMVTLDALGLDPDDPGLIVNVEKEEFRFKTDSGKIDAFNSWFQQQLDLGILEIDPITGDPWTAQYVDSAYKKGAVRAFVDTRKELSDEAGFIAGKQSEFLTSAFAAPETVQKIRTISTRVFEELKGISATMSQQISRNLADGLSQGLGPREIARNMTNSISGISRTRANVLARTEIVRAHAEGQLDAFEVLNVTELGIMQEFSTAGDDRVCFPKYTLVDTERGSIPIQDITIGDKVYTRDGLQEVYRTMERKYSSDMITIYAGKKKVTCTDNHLIWTETDGWIEAKDIIEGMDIETRLGQLVEVTAITISKIEYDILVYNFEVKNNPEYYANDILVHNCPQCLVLDGTVFTVKEARGIIPRHPNCRCAWIPAGVGEISKKNRAVTKDQVEARVEASLIAGLPKKDKKLGLKEAKKRTTNPLGSLKVGKRTVAQRRRLGKGSSIIPKPPTPLKPIKKKVPVTKPKKKRAKKRTSTEIKLDEDKKTLTKLQKENKKKAKQLKETTARTEKLKRDLQVLQDKEKADKKDIDDLKKKVKDTKAEIKQTTTDTRRIETALALEDKGGPPAIQTVKKIEAERKARAKAVKKPTPPPTDKAKLDAKLKKQETVKLEKQAGLDKKKTDKKVLRKDKSKKIATDKKKQTKITKEFRTFPDKPGEVSVPGNFTTGQTKAVEWAETVNGGQEWRDFKVNGVDERILNDYSSAEAFDMNNLLRKTKFKPTEPEFISIVRERIEELDTALARAPKMTENVLLFRGMDDPRLIAKKGSLKGLKFDDKGFGSYSLNKRVANDFADDQGVNSIVASLRTPKGQRAAWVGGREDSKDGRAISDHRNESEFVLPRNLNYKIVSETTDSRGRTNIVLEITDE